MTPHILTHTGVDFWFLDPRSEDFKIEDIAHALSQLCRFTGHTKEFYSVAQHSVAVSCLVRPEFALEGLLHDAAEAYLGDVSSPLKFLLPKYQAIENLIQDSIAKAFKLNTSFPAQKEIKLADLRMLALERELLLPVGPLWDSLKGVQSAPAELLASCWNSAQAREQFFARFNQLLAFRQPAQNSV